MKIKLELFFSPIIFIFYSFLDHVQTHLNFHIKIIIMILISVNRVLKDVKFILFVLNQLENQILKPLSFLIIEKASVLVLFSHFFKLPRTNSGWKMALFFRFFRDIGFWAYVSESVTVILIDRPNFNR